MKTTNAKAFINKAAIIFSAVCIVIGAASCNKSATPAQPSTTTATVTEADAANAVTDAVTPQTSGMVTQLNQATVIAGAPAYTCGEAFDSSITGASAAGASITYAFNLAWGWKFTCANPASFMASFKGSSSYGTADLSSSDSISGSFTVTGIEPAAQDYIFSSTYTRNGSMQSAIGNKNKFTSTITVTSSNILVSKTTDEIVSGSAAVTISGASSSGNAFSFSGTITFTGSKTATLAISGGGTYEMNW